jgi:hypothetical protein
VPLKTQGLGSGRLPSKNKSLGGSQNYCLARPDNVAPDAKLQNPDFIPKNRPFRSPEHDATAPKVLALLPPKTAFYAENAWTIKSGSLNVLSARYLKFFTCSL